MLKRFIQIAFLVGAIALAATPSKAPTSKPPAFDGGVPLPPCPPMC